MESKKTNNQIFKFIEDYMYNERLGDLEFIKKEFYKNYNLFNAKSEILLQLYDNNLSTEDLKEINFNFSIKGLSKIKSDLKQDNYIIVSNKEGKKEYYTISEEGIQYLKQYITKEFINKNNYILENIRLNRKDKINSKKDSPEFTKERIQNVMELLDSRNSIEDFINNGFFVFDILEILELDIELGEYIINNFSEAYKVFKICLKDSIPEISKVKDNFENIKFINIDKIITQQYKISDIPKKTDEFINTKGILLKRNPQIREEVTKFYYLCDNPSCPFNEEKLTATSKIKACPKCKSSLDLIDRKIKKVIDLEIKDSENDTSLKIKAYDNLINEVCNLKIGEEISVNGSINLLEMKNQNSNEVFLNRQMILNNLKSSANSVYLTKEEEDEVKKQLDYLDKNNISYKDYLLDYIYQLYPYHPKELFDLYLLPQLLKHDVLGEDIIHILSIGSPNTYKTSFLKFLSEIFPKQKNIQFRQLSVDKFYGGVKADGLTDVGIAMTQRNGSLIIDEIDKDPDGYEKSSNMLNQVMTEQEASKERVGASIHLKNVDMRIYGVMNHNNRYKSEGKTIQWIHKNMHESTLTRFFLIDFDGFINNKIKENIIEKMATNNSKILKDYDFEIRKKIIIYLRKQEVNLEPIKEDISTFLKTIFKAFQNYEHLTRNIQQVKNIIIGLCRLKGIEEATKEEFEEAVKLIKWTYETQGLDLFNNLKQLDNSINRNNYFDDIKYCCEQIIKEIDNDNTNTKEIQKVLSESFSIDLINTSIDKLKQEGMIFEPRRNEIRRVN